MAYSRLQFEVDEAQLAFLTELQQICRLRTKKDLFENAVTLLSWAVNEVHKGNVVGSFGGGVLKEFSAPFLHNIAMQRPDRFTFADRAVVEEVPPAEGERIRSEQAPPAATQASVRTSPPAASATASATTFRPPRKRIHQNP